MKRVETDVAIIGAGPAGLSAATAAAGAGARVDVVDAGAAPGGQYWMQGLGPEAAASLQGVEGRLAIDAARAAGATLHAGAEVWAVFPDLRICATRDGQPLEIAPRAIVVATGAHDRVMPFPGWTLPGVMTPGAGQRLAKLARMPAGRRIVLGGSGPFLLAVAKTLAAIGAAPAAFIEARRPNLAIARHLARHPERWREAAGLLASLRRIPLRRYGWVVTEALGHSRVEAVRIAPLAGGVVDTAAAAMIEDVDALLVGWGFRPSIDVTALLRCDHAYESAAGGWHCRADAGTGATSRPSVFAAGEVTGVAGSRPARLSGTLAGLSAAASLGFGSRAADDARRLASRGLERARAFARGLNALFAPPPGLCDLAADDTIVCRCEEVARGDILAAGRDGAGGVQGAKLWTRAGMGPCQGRVCGWAIAELVGAATGQGAAGAGFNQPRIPIRPVPLSAVLETLR